MANNVDPDETARYEPSHQDLHCLQKTLFSSAELKGLRSTYRFAWSYKYSSDYRNKGHMTGSAVKSRKTWDSL